MGRHLGDHFDGVISGVTPYGFFVRLDNMGVEGMVRMSSIDDDYYHFDQKGYRMVGRRTGRTFQLGGKVKVGITKVDTVAHEMDLFLVSPPKKEPKKKPAKKSRSTRKAGKRKRK